MKTKSKIKRMLYWLSRRSIFLVTTLLFAIVIILFWFLSAGISPDNERTIIGIAAVTAFLSAVSAIATLLQAVEVQKQRENLERPYITAYFDGSNSGALYFVIENSGNSPALDVKFKFNPSPVNFAGIPLNEISLFANPISFLPAGKVIRQIIDASNRFLAEGKPLKYEISTTYSSVFGDSFDEIFEHDLEYLKQVTLPIKTVEDHLKDISKELGELTRLIKKAQGLNSFVVESPDEYSSRIEILQNKRNEQKGVKNIFHTFLMWLFQK